MDDKLKEKIEKFNKDLKSKKLKDELRNLEQQRADFVSKYDSDSKILDMKVDDYIVGKGGDTFCRRIEYQLKDLGSIKGSNSSKYGVYFGVRRSDKKKKYRYNANLGCKNIDSAFKKVKELIVKLLKAGKSGDLKAINKIKLSPMFRGKILYIYYPEKYLPIYSEADLNYFLSQLKIDEKGLNILEKQKKLIEFKNEDPIIKTWSLLEFQKFLYKTFPDVKQDTKKANQVADLLLQEEITKNPFSKKDDAYANKKDPKKKNNLIKVNEVLVYPRDPQLAKKALKKSSFMCEFDGSHERFKRKSDGLPYTEAHHLVPLSEHANFDVNLDQEENIVSLCCNCHAKIHRGKDNEEIIKKLYNLKKQGLEDAGILITEEELLKIYK